MVNRFKYRVNALNFQPPWLILLIDVFFSFVSALLVFVFISQSDNFYFQVPFYSSLIKFLITGLISTSITKSYRGVIRHTSLEDILTLLKTSAIQLSLLFSIEIIGITLLNNTSTIILYYYFLSSAMSLFLFFNYRMGIRYVFLFARTASSEGLKIGIFGAGESGILLSNYLKNDRANKMDVIAFFDDELSKCSKLINGIPVVSAQRLESFARKNGIKQIIASPRVISNVRKEELFEACKKAGVQLKVIPQDDIWFVEKKKPEKLHDIEILDLLGREQISTDKTEIQAMISGRAIMVTGAAGSIGSELARQIIAENPSLLIVLDQAESPLHDLVIDLKNIMPEVTLVPVLTDVVNKKRLDYIFSTYKIDVIFHAAAYKHVPMQEQHPYEAFYCNIQGTYNLANLAVSYEVGKFIMVSTDKAVNPTNIMGATKRAAEIYTQSLNTQLAGKGTQFITTRFGNVLGSNGSVVPLFKKQIAAGGPLTITHPEITRYFMTISEACNLVLEAGAMGKGGEIFVFDMGTPVKINDLAVKMIKLSGKELGRDIEIKYTGLRDGEKLYEELLANGENTKPTYNKKIMIARVRPHAYQEVVSQFNEIFSYMNEMDEMGMVGSLKTLIPEFKSNQSRFCHLDNIAKDSLRKKEYV
nr:nucleoside-diphosphate sugar epimerase/dehydratase [Pedobacter sp. SYSU D00873]